LIGGRAQLPTFEEVELHGPRPEVADELFVVQGHRAHRVRKEQIVSLRVTQNPVAAERARSVEGRLPVVVNAGTPTQTNPIAGECFCGHAFVPKADETHEVEWRDSAEKDAPPTLHVSDHRYCSAVDVLARYAGGEALQVGGRALFVAIFLNEGSSDIAPRVGEGAPGWDKYTAQRQVIGRNLSKLFLVYPEAMPPVLQRDAGPAMLACLASIAGDKVSTGAPGGMYQSSIAGYHDRSRLHVLPLGHVSQIRDLVKHFQLEQCFPPFTDSWTSLQEWLPMQQMRTRAIDALGPPRGGVMTPDWLARRRAVPFDTPWVQHCSMEHPTGKRNAQGEPVLLPLVHGSAEERNGIPWLTQDPENAGTEHYRQVSDVLDRIGGEAQKKVRAEALDAKAEAELPEDPVLRALHVENAKYKRKVKTLKSDLDAAKLKIAELEADVNRLTMRNLELAHIAHQPSH
tara:strand:- start:283 stop:1653 length:1371 start_codon:yes stop_codon:yes gene_type:complete